MIPFLLALVAAAMPISVHAAETTTQEVFEIKLRDAETKALSASFRLKSFVAEEGAANAQASAELTNLYPRLSFQGSYDYYGYVPKVSLGGGPPIAFGTIRPTVSVHP